MTITAFNEENGYLHLMFYRRDGVVYAHVEGEPGISAAISPAPSPIEIPNKYPNSDSNFASLQFKAIDPEKREIIFEWTEYNPESDE